MAQLLVASWTRQFELNEAMTQTECRQLSLVAHSTDRSLPETRQLTTLSRRRSALFYCRANAVPASRMLAIHALFPVVQVIVNR